MGRVPLLPGQHQWGSGMGLLLAQVPGGPGVPLRWRSAYQHNSVAKPETANGWTGKRKEQHRVTSITCHTKSTHNHIQFIFSTSHLFSWDSDP